MTTFDYDKLAPFSKIVIEYAGSGDEGFIEDIHCEPEGFSLSHELEDDVTQIAYDILEKHYGGWEINEGSAGHITIDVKQRKTSVHHGWTVESQEWEDKEFV